MFRRIISILPFVLVLGYSFVAQAEYRDLCLSVPAACDWSGPNVPKFDADVCWSSSTGLVAKGSLPCPSGSWPYHLGFGEVIDPVTGEVQAYAPLDEACSVPGLCLDGPPPPGAQEHAICCEWGVCVDLDTVPCDSSTSTAYICYDGVSNQDGTIDCFEGDEI